MVSLLGVFVGLLLVGCGAFGVKYAYGITAFEEQVDAIGSRRSGPVEPADWNVALTKVFAAVVACAGVFVTLLALLD